MSEEVNITATMLYSRSLNGVLGGYDRALWEIEGYYERLGEHLSGDGKIVIMDASTWETAGRYAPPTPQIVVSREETHKEHVFTAKTARSAMLACVFAGHKEMIFMGGVDLLKQVELLVDSVVEMVVCDSTIPGDTMYRHPLEHATKQSEQLYYATLKAGPGKDLVANAYERIWHVNADMDLKDRFNGIGFVSTEEDTIMAIDLYYQMRKKAEEIVKERLKAKSA